MQAAGNDHPADLPGGERRARRHQGPVELRIHSTATGVHTAALGPQKHWGGERRGMLSRVHLLLCGPRSPSCLIRLGDGAVPSWTRSSHSILAKHMQAGHFHSALFFPPCSSSL